MVTVVPHLWFDNCASSAVEFYLSVFPNSEIIDRPGSATAGSSADRATGDQAAHVRVIDFRIGELTVTAFDGGPHHEFNDAISLSVTCDSQAEVDAVWAGLTADGGIELPSGWCRDRFGVSWQVVPSGLNELLGDPDPERAARAVDALLAMNRIVLADIEAAMDGAD